MGEKLSGKVAAITGAASGIGLECARILLSEGARVVLVDRDEDALKTVCAELGPQALPLRVDLTDPASVSRMMPQILEQAGQLDIFHANAGSYIGGEILKGDPDAWDRMLSLNINAAFRSIHAVLPHMVERKTGDIIVTCSVAGHFPTYWEPVYSGSKWAITSFVQGMRRQMLGHGVRVAQISPGPVVSALLKDWPEENLRKAKEAGALIDPEDVAEAIIFMLSRKRTITIRDIIILPSTFDRV